MKSCPKCGVQLPDEAVFCNNCGASLAATPQPIPAPQAPITPAPVNNATLDSAKEKNKNTKVGMAVIIGVAALVFILLIVFVISLCGGGYKAPIKQLVNDMNKRNTDASTYLENFAPGYVVSSYESVCKILEGTDFYDDYYDDNSRLEDYYDDLEDEYGDDYKVTYEIKKAEHLDKDDIEDLQEVWSDYYEDFDDDDITDEDYYEDFQEYLDDYYDTELSSGDLKKLQNSAESFMKDFEDFKISDAYEVKIKMSIEGDENSYKQTMTIYVIKVNGKWIIDPFSSDYDSTFDFDIAAGCITCLY